MKISYDSNADVMYIYFDPMKKSTRTEEVGVGINVDYAGKKLIGIEILDASERLAKKDIEKMTIEVPTYRANMIA